MSVCRGWMAEECALSSRSAVAGHVTVSTYPANHCLTSRGLGAVGGWQEARRLRQAESVPASKYLALRMAAILETETMVELSGLQNVAFVVLPLFLPVGDSTCIVMVCFLSLCCVRSQHEC